jgi:acetoin utilization deacetylase AcuC-like enzyme
MAFMALQIVHHPRYNAELAKSRRFPIGKFKRIAEILAAEQLAGPGGFHVPQPIEPGCIARAHDRPYVEQVMACTVPEKVEREIGFPIRERLVFRARCASGGTLLAARLALTHGIACNTAGGGHHARRRHGAGFCVFNDVGVAVHALRATGEIERALVADCDVHQGDGTADVFSDDPAVFTFSIHAEKNYPTRKVASDLDIGLPDATGDGAYLDALREALPGLIDRHRPDIVFFNAGVDPHRDDDLGRLALTDNGLRERERMVIGAARDKGLPVACVVGGGYSKDIEALARRHAGMYRVAAEFA